MKKNVATDLILVEKERKEKSKIGSFRFKKTKRKGSPEEKLNNQGRRFQLY